MAALLIEIKSRMLLPRPAAGDLEEDPRAELVRRLMEYERMKSAARPRTPKRFAPLVGCGTRITGGAFGVRGCAAL